MPHRLVALEEISQGEGMLYNLYIPLPEFLQWPLTEQLRQEVMDRPLLPWQKPDHDYLVMRLGRWYEDFQSEHPEFKEIILGELSLLLKRISFQGWDHPESFFLRRSY